MDQQFDLSSQESLKEQIALLERRVERERASRKEAERLLETKSLELFRANQKLNDLNKNLEKTVRGRTETLLALLNNLHAGVLLNDDEGAILFINDQFLQIFNIPFTSDELVGKDQRSSAEMVKQVFAEPEKFIAIIDQCRDTNIEVKGYELLMKDGRIVDCDFVPIQTEEEFVGQLWQIRDVTEQREAEKNLTRSEEKYRGIIENMELGLLEVDVNHTILRAYDWFCDMTGYTEEELLGKNAVDVFLPPDQQRLMKEQDSKRKRGEQSIYESKLLKKDGSEIWVLISGAPFYDQHGNMTGSIGIHYDITARKRLEQDLTEARNQAERARDAEKQFLANMSHEIRNPINAIVGITNLLYDTKPTEKQLAHLDKLKYSADILMGLISGILDISKIESGKFELVERPVSLKDTLQALIEIAEFRKEEPSVDLLLHWDEDIRSEVLIDPTVLNQIFLNLLGNAIKFTEHGKVEVRSTLVEESEDKLRIVFAVHDTGVGIAPDKLESIFKSFNQGDSETKLKFGGTGLGLAIVKQLVAKYGGKITAESTPGAGSTFQFDLQLKKAQKTEEVKEEVQPAMSRGHVLIVEDNKINQSYLSGILENWGATYDIANNGEEAMQAVAASLYDIILMDIRMPVMDGYEATIRIRTDLHNENHDVPIVALTASALVDERERALAAGMNYHLTKPFTPDQLAGVFDKFGLNQKRALQHEDLTAGFLPELDAEYLSAFYAEDFKRAELMFGIFIRSIDEDLGKLEKAVHDQDWPLFSKTAHKIKPNFAMVGLTEISNIMKRYEGFKSIADIPAKFNEELEESLKQIEEGKQLVIAQIEKFKKMSGV